MCNSGRHRAWKDVLGVRKERPRKENKRSSTNLKTLRSRKDTMRKFASRFAVAVLSVLSVSGLAFAQSSGNFSAAGTPASCKIGTDGNLSGGTGTTVFVANISTPSGNGTTLDIRPAFVTGLFTDTK